jgi:hypothetical protein
LQPFEDRFLASELGEVASTADLEFEYAGELGHAGEDKLRILVSDGFKDLVASVAPEVLQTQQKLAGNRANELRRWRPEMTATTATWISLQPEFGVMPHQAKSEGSRRKSGGHATHIILVPKIPARRATIATRR